MTFLATVQPNPAEVSNDHFEAIMVFLGIVVTAVVGLAGIVIPLLLSAKRDAREARVQVKNNHGTNLREEADDRHNENARKLDWLIASVTYLLERSNAHGDSIAELEDTLTHRPQPKDT